MRTSALRAGPGRALSEEPAQDARIAPSQAPQGASRGAKQPRLAEPTPGLPEPGEDPRTDASLLAQLARLKTLSVLELKAEWRTLFGKEAPNNSRPFLELRLGYRLQELAYGGLSKSTVRLLDALADEYRGIAVRKPVLSDTRRPIAGTKLIREWAGVEHTVTVLRDGFEYQGRRYKSLSAIARSITGTRWNGWRFFGLRSGEAQT